MNDCMTAKINADKGKTVERYMMMIDANIDQKQPPTPDARATSSSFDLGDRIIGTASLTEIAAPKLPVASCTNLIRSTPEIGDHALGFCCI